ncbi:hypothetical protein [Novosphingobium sp. CECT 9465]|uniref:hypothetical protein n=1 Tax=Novosphingobium sp. CECT 9465 TaxID=2829794 RepID=UPI001E338A77|nr:hypothetical protein [Novosphingobium sp. CECT 9465]
MSDAAQIIVATGVGILLTLLGLGWVIWALRCDPKRSHYRLPSIAALMAPIITALFLWGKIK